MKRQRIYIDTSIVGGFFDKTFETETKLFFKRIKNNEFDCLEIKEKIQTKVYEKTKDITFPKLNDYLDKSLENDIFWQKLLKSNKIQERVMAFV